MLTVPIALPRLLFVLALTVGSLPIGIGLAQAGVNQPRSARAILIENISDSEMRKYAKIRIEMEPLRLAALESIRSQVDGNMPRLECHQPSSMNSLPRNARKVFVNYCNQSELIARKHGMSLERFNDITSTILSSPAQRGSLQRQVNCLQSGRC